MQESEVWYEVEYSRLKEDDWYATTDRSDDLDSAKVIQRAYMLRRQSMDFEYRIVKVTVTREVVTE